MVLTHKDGELGVLVNGTSVRPIVNCNAISIDRLALNQTERCFAEIYCSYNLVINIVLHDLLHCDLELGWLSAGSDSSSGVGRMRINRNDLNGRLASGTSESSVARANESTSVARTAAIALRGASAVGNGGRASTAIDVARRASLVGTGLADTIPANAARSLSAVLRASSTVLQAQSITISIAAQFAWSAIGAEAWEVLEVVAGEDQVGDIAESLKAAVQMILAQREDHGREGEDGGREGASDLILRKINVEKGLAELWQRASEVVVGAVEHQKEWQSSNGLGNRAGKMVV